MRFRLARHTARFHEIISFYTTILGMEKLGSFENHDGYDGMMLGFEQNDWHLEFTRSANEPEHTTDEDDLIVLYTESKRAFVKIQDMIIGEKISTVMTKNPYWNEKGIAIVDPDGFLVVIMPPNR